MPLGERYVDPLLIKVAREELAATSKLRYSARFVDIGAAPDAAHPSLTVRHDRPFNIIEEEGAFTASRGTSVEGGTFSLSSSHPHGLVELDVRDDMPVERADLLAQYAAWEVVQTMRSRLAVDVAWAAWEEAGAGAFVTSEMTTQRLTTPRPADLGGRGSPTVVDESYLELVTRYEQPQAGSPDRMRARYRIAQYLSLPGAPAAAASTSAARRLASQADGRAIALLDYDLEMERVGGRET